MKGRSRPNRERPGAARPEAESKTRRAKAGQTREGARRRAARPRNKTGKATAPRRDTETEKAPTPGTRPEVARPSCHRGQAGRRLPKLSGVRSGRRVREVDGSVDVAEGTARRRMPRAMETPTARARVTRGRMHDSSPLTTTAPYTQPGDTRRGATRRGRGSRYGPPGRNAGPRQRQHPWGRRPAARRTAAGPPPARTQPCGSRARWPRSGP